PSPGSESSAAPRTSGRPRRAPCRTAPDARDRSGAARVAARRSSGPPAQERRAFAATPTRSPVLGLQSAVAPPRRYDPRLGLSVRPAPAPPAVLRPDRGRATAAVL